MTPLVNMLPWLCIPLQRVVGTSGAPSRARACARGGAHPMGLHTHEYAAWAAYSSDVWVTPLVRRRMLARVAAHIQWDSSGPCSRPGCWKTDAKMMRSSLEQGRTIGKPQQIGTRPNQTRPLLRKSAVSAASACARHGRLPASCDVLAHARLRSLTDRLRKLTGLRRVW